MTPPLRVLVVDQGRGVWGAQRYLLRLAPLLRGHGIELTLAGPRTLELHDVWRAEGFSAVHLDIPVDRSIRTTAGLSLGGMAREGARVPRVARMIAGAVREGQFDALWANSHWTHLDSSIASRICDKPVVLHLHEEAVPGLGVWLRASAVRLAARTVAVSEGVAQQLPAAAAWRVSVIANGVDTDVMSPASSACAARVKQTRQQLGVAEGDVMVLAATRLDPTKHIEDLIAVARDLDDPRVRLVIAGSTSAYPDYERHVRAQADALPPGRVLFCGSRDDIADLFRACDVVLHAGMVEGMPLGLIEAQSCGKPVVAYDVAGVPEAVTHGCTGLLAGPRDVPGLTAATRQLVEKPGLRLRMGCAGRAHVLAHHWIGTQAQRNAELLAEMSLLRQVAAA